MQSNISLTSLDILHGVPQLMVSPLPDLNLELASHFPISDHDISRLIWTLYVNTEMNLQQSGGTSKS